MSIENLISLKKNKVQIILICGGLGSRIKKYTQKDKNLIFFNKKPIIVNHLEKILSYKFKNVTVSLNSKQKNLFKVINKFNYKNNLNINFSIENKPLDTGGAILNSVDFNFDYFLILYGDIYHHFSFDDFIYFHFKNKSDCTILSQPNSRPYDSDLVYYSRSFKIHKIKKYPHSKKINSFETISAIFLLDKKLIVGEKIRKINFTNFLIKKLKIYNFRAYKTFEYIRDIGTPTRILQTRLDIKKKLHLKLKKNNNFLNILRIKNIFNIENINFKQIQKLNKNGTLILLIYDIKITLNQINSIKKKFIEHQCYFDMEKQVKNVDKYSLKSMNNSLSYKKIISDKVY